MRGGVSVKPAGIKLPKAHRVTKRLANGWVAIYWYRCRGGPLLMKFSGESLGAALRAEAIGAADLAAAYAVPAILSVPAVGTIRTLMTKFKVAPDGLEKTAESTKRHWRRSLDAIDRKFGDLPLKSLAARGVKAEFIEWRNSRKETPRQADYDLTVLKRLLSWAKENDLLDANPAAGIKSIYRSNRADMVVEPHELDAILALVTSRGGLAIRLAASTGLRREDLVNVKWDHVKGNHITFATGKSRGRKTVLVPLYGDGKAVIDELRSERDQLVSDGRVPSTYVLTTEFKKRWKPDSLTQAFGRAAKKLGIGKRLNDLRGTAITRFVLAEVSEEEIADIVGWELARVRNIRKHYVDANRIAQGVATKLENAAAAG